MAESCPPGVLDLVKDLSELPDVALTASAATWAGRFVQLALALRARARAVLDSGDEE